MCVRMEIARWGDAIYLCIRITNVPNVFIGGGDIFDGTDTFPGLTLSSDNYVGGVQDTTILPSRGKKIGEPLTHESKFALRSELGELIRIARISRPNAL